METVEATPSHVLPEETQAKIKSLDHACDMLAQQLGYLQMNFRREENAVLMEIQKIHAQQRELVNAAAKAAGLDVEKHKWLFDANAMTLTKQETQEQAIANA